MALDRVSTKRRQFLRALTLTPLGMASLPLLGGLHVGTARAAQGTSQRPDQVLQTLLAGNQRFVAATQRGGGPVIEHRMELTRGQNPFAIILGCANSRVPPEIVFD